MPSASDRTTTRAHILLCSSRRTAWRRSRSMADSSYNSFPRSMTDVSRRRWFKDVGAAGAGSAFVVSLQSPAPRQPNGAIVPRMSTGDVFVPPRGRSFQKLSFDFPEPSVVFEGYEFGFRIFTRENVYGLHAEA